MNDLNSLPTPPQGQAGLDPSRFSHLPPPPQGQQGMTLDQINSGPSLASQASQAQSESNRLNNPLTIAGETAGGTLSTLFSGAGKFLNSAIHAPVDLVRGVMGKAPVNANTIQNNAYQNTGKVFEGQMSPLSATTQAVGQTVGGAADVLGGEGLLRSGISKVAPLAEQGVKSFGESKSFLKGVGAVEDNLSQANKVSEMVSPKPTLKETRLAQSEGRLVKGKPATFLKGGTADTILPSAKTKSATQTIVNNIPGASKMNPSELYNAVEGHIDETAKGLRPQMEATPIKPETVQKLNDNWQATKKAQIADAPASEEANVAKRQLKFEEFLKKSGSNHQGDLWDTRIAYDKSIPNSVKKANSLSPESLQLQKSEWLQNRGILNNAINDTISGMGQKSQQAFKSLSDLYEAKNGILSRAKLQVKPEASGLSKAYNSKTGRVVRGVTKTALGVDYAKNKLGL